MWINNNTIEKSIKETDEIPEGFSKGRLKKPKKIDSLKQVVPREELIKYYIVQNNTFIDTMSHFNLEFRKDLRQLLNFYDIQKTPKQRAKNNNFVRSHEEYIEYGKKSSKTQKEAWNKKSEEEKIKWSEK